MVQRNMQHLSLEALLNFMTRYVGFPGIARSLRHQMLQWQCLLFLKSVLLQRALITSVLLEWSSCSAPSPLFFFWYCCDAKIPAANNSFQVIKTCYRKPQPNQRNKTTTKREGKRENEWFLWAT